MTELDYQEKVVAWKILMDEYKYGQRSDELRERIERLDAELEKYELEHPTEVEA